MNEPQVKISEVNPGEQPIERAAVELSTKLRFILSVKKTRDGVIDAVKSARDIPVEDQDYILRRIAAIPAEHDILQLAVYCHPHKAGFNYSFTVCEI